MKRFVRRQYREDSAWLPPETTAFLASYVATVSGVFAVAVTVDRPEFTRTILFLLTAGYVASFAAQMEHIWWGKMLRTLATTVGLGSIPILSFFVSPGSIFPTDALAQQDLRTAVLLAWFAVILSYLVGSYVLNRWVPLSFPVVPTLSMFGLVGSMNPNANVIVAFMTFVCASIFLVSYENTIRVSSPGMWKPSRLKSTSYQHLLLAGGFYAPVALCALGLAALMRWVTPPSLIAPVDRMRSAMIEALGSANWTGFSDSFDLRSGSYTLSRAPRMVVYAKEGFNWRGRVYNRYDGSGWHRSFRPGNEQFIRETTAGRYAFAELPQEHRLVEAEFLCSNTMPSVLYSPGAPLEVSFAGLTLRMDSTHCLRTDSPLTKGTRYRVQAAVPLIDEHADELREEPGEYTESLVEQSYLQVPRRNYKLRSLSLSIVEKRHSVTPYQKAEGLTEYLHSHCKYSLRVPPVPGLEDAAEFFVFDSRRGACDMFATALALMCRSVDVPARVVTGYAPGEAKDMKNGGGMKRFVVRDSHAHAWVEIFINPKWGWVPMDPSAGAEQIGDSWLRALTSSHLWIAGSQQIRRNLFPLVVTALMLWSAGYLIRQPKTQRNKVERRVRRRLPRAREDLCRVYRKMVWNLSAVGVPRSKSLAPGEWLEVARTNEVAGAESVRDYVEGLTEQFITACYSERPVSRGDVVSARERLKQLRRSLRNTRRNAKRMET